MAYPLFDSGYTLLAADLETRLKDQVGSSARALGIDPRLLLQSYYSGYTVTATLALLALHYPAAGI